MPGRCRSTGLGWAMAAGPGLAEFDNRDDLFRRRARWIVRDLHQASGRLATPSSVGAPCLLSWTWTVFLRDRNASSPIASCIGTKRAAAQGRRTRLDRGKQRSVVSELDRGAEAQIARWQHRSAPLRL